MRSSYVLLIESVVVCIMLPMQDMAMRLRLVRILAIPKSAILMTRLVSP